MAKQGGPYLINRTYGNISFYIRQGIGLVRTKSTLDAQRFKTDPAFANSRKSADKFGLANKMASPIYHTIPLQFRERTQYIALRNLGVELFRAGASIAIVQKTMEVAVQNLINNLQSSPEKITDEKETPPKAAISSIATPQLVIFPSCVNSIRQHRRKRLRRSSCHAALTAAA